MAPHLSVPRRVRIAAGVAIISFAAVLAAIEAMALRGQVDFSRQVLHLNGYWLAIPPIALEGGTLAAATLTLWAVLAGDSAALSRLMTAICIAAAAYANYRGAQHAGRPTLAAEYLAGASVLAYLMWHTILTRIRHAELRTADAIEDPLPRFRLLRWLLAFNETRQAFTIAVRENLTRPRDALSRIREIPALPPARQTPPTDEPDTVDHLVALAAERGGKRLAIEKAAQIISSHEPTRVQQWLSKRGIDIDLSYVSRTLKDQPQAINGNGQHS
ncbi:DUF2637 domain-containing protein [Actinoallomurus iriomotensis]|uniref:DUF2637 domain-containing protein n=1 Tax=Actinoallomurus iriomotensis TaxID=478107 RepID=A0A9W6VQ05_9ACTN|nr:DUF2637 domain-containing protein [Actinoallomurus iriomotensis]GLY80543.1 hypothetical protein Airi01_088100 [Actinoallomurus iriomotensis]